MNVQVDINMRQGVATGKPKVSKRTKTGIERCPLVGAQDGKK
jgi:hypothetical protein